MEPSPTDLEQAWENFLYVIVGPVDDEKDLDIRAYELKGGTFETVRLEPVPVNAGT